MQKNDPRLTDEIGTFTYLESVRILTKVNEHLSRGRIPLSIEDTNPETLDLVIQSIQADLKGGADDLNT